MKTATSVRSSMAQALVTAMGAGSASLPKIEIYTGTMPASMGGTITDTLLAELEMSATPATESGGVVALEPVSNDASANADGTAGWLRILDRDGAEVAYLTVSLTGGGGELQLNDTAILTGDPVAVTSGTITVGQ